MPQVVTLPRTERRMENESASVDWKGVSPRPVESACTLRRVQCLLGWPRLRWSAGRVTLRLPALEGPYLNRHGIVSMRFWRHQEDAIKCHVHHIVVLILSSRRCAVRLWNLIVVLCSPPPTRPTPFSWAESAVGSAVLPHESDHRAERTACKRRYSCSCPPNTTPP